MRKPQFKYEPNTIIVYVLNILIVFFLFVLSLSLKYNLLSHVLMLSQQLKHFEMHCSTITHICHVIHVCV